MTHIKQKLENVGMLATTQHIINRNDNYNLIDIDYPLSRVKPNLLYHSRYLKSRCYLNISTAPAGVINITHFSISSKRGYRYYIHYIYSDSSRNHGILRL